MAFSDFFHAECDPVEPHDGPNHVIFSCLQWRNPNLAVMPQVAKQMFAVMYGDELTRSVTAALERAYILDAMSPVKLIAVHEDQLYLFLDAGVSSARFPEIEALWMVVAHMSRIRLRIDFANVSEVNSGRSDYVFREDAREILELYTLGIERCDLLAVDDSVDDGFIDDDQWFQLPNEGKSKHAVKRGLLLSKIAGCMNHSPSRSTDIYAFPYGRELGVEELRLRTMPPLPAGQFNVKFMRSLAKRRLS